MRFGACIRCTRKNGSRRRRCSGPPKRNCCRRGFSAPATCSAWWPERSSLGAPRTSWRSIRRGRAMAVLCKGVAGRLFLGGRSYGGRQATMLCAAEPGLVSGLLLLSYPLHPPRKPEQLRVQHLPNLRTPSLLVHGTRDPFGSIEEMKKAIDLIPAKNELLEVEGAGHDLGFKGKSQVQELRARILAAFENHRS